MIEEIAVGYIDYILLAIVGLILPLLGRILEMNTKFNEKQNSLDNKRIYYSNIALLWTPTIAVIAVWIGLERPFQALGLSLEVTNLGYIALMASSLACLYFAWDYYRIKASKTVRDKAKADFEKLPADVRNILPSTQQEYNQVKFLAITAGITEEIMYRGFLIWGFSLFTNIWLASLLSIFCFTLGHLYQQKLENLLRVAFAALAFTGLYLLSGSLIPGIILHIVMDLAAMSTWWYIHKQDHQEQAS